jgi:hypothetical protein
MPPTMGKRGMAVTGADIEQVLFLAACPDEAAGYPFGREPDGLPSQPWKWQEPAVRNFLCQNPPFSGTWSRGTIRPSSSDSADPLQPGEYRGGERVAIHG